MNRPCIPRTAGADADTNPDPTGTGQNDTDNSDTSHTGNNGGGPVIVLGGTPYNLDGSGPSGSNSPSLSPHTDTQLPDHFEPTPEPGYMVVTGLAFAAVWVFARKRRIA